MNLGNECCIPNCFMGINEFTCKHYNSHKTLVFLMCLICIRFIIWSTELFSLDRLGSPLIGHPCFESLLVPLLLF